MVKVRRDSLANYHNSSLEKTDIIRLRHYAIVAADALRPAPTAAMFVAAAAVVAVVADVAVAFVAATNVGFAALNCGHAVAFAVDGVRVVAAELH